MTKMISFLTFVPPGEQKPQCEEETSLCAWLPAKIETNRALFAALKQQLHFPANFHTDWNRLYDYFRDFGLWTNAQRVTLIHTDVPLVRSVDPIERRMAATYLSLLVKSIAFLKEDIFILHPSLKNYEKELVALFPRDCYEQVLDILRSQDTL